MRKVQIQGHRGACAYAPENTLPSFRLSMDMGSDGIECDIHLTKDQQFVVCHDDTIDRTSDGAGKIPALTMDEIRSHDFGAKFDEKFRGVTAPTLQEMLDVVKGMNPINIEIKDFGPGFDRDESLNQFYAILEKYDIIGNTIVSSFEAPILKRLKKLHPDVYTCFLYSRRPGAAAYAQSLGCSAIHPYFGSLKKSTVDSAHRRGMKVNCWTVDREEDIRRMIEMGCDGIITDKPDVALRIAEEE